MAGLLSLFFSFLIFFSFIYFYFYFIFILFDWMALFWQGTIIIMQYCLFDTPHDLGIVLEFALLKRGKHGTE